MISDGSEPQLITHRATYIVVTVRGYQQVAVGWHRAGAKRSGLAHSPACDVNRPNKKRPRRWNRRGLDGYYV